MTDPARRPGPHRSAEPIVRRLRIGRTAVAFAVVLVTMVSAAALSIALSGGASDLGQPTASPIASVDPLVLVPVPTQRSVRGTFPPASSSIPSVGSQQIRAKRIQIHRLGIDLKVIDGDGIDAPIGKAAHYPGSGWPGGGSNIYIYAHARKGVFLSLWEARIGDEVVLTLTDGTDRTYVVDKVLPKVPWNAVKYLEPTPTEQLTLQTSTSYYPTAPRFIVLAHPVR